MIDMHYHESQSSPAMGYSSGQNCNEASVKLLAEHEEEHARIDHHSKSPENRTVGASHVTTSITAPPPTPSVRMGGNWSIGKVLEIYGTNGDAGDCHAGRILDFPHNFKCSYNAPLLSESIEEGIPVCFGGSVKKEPDLIWLFHLLLAGLVSALLVVAIWASLLKYL